MADRFELMLARRLGDYADARVRPADPMRIATAAVAATRFDRRRWFGGLGPTRRWLVLLAAGALLLIGVTFGALVGRPPTPPAVSPAPSESSRPAPSEAAFDVRRAILESEPWYLEFPLSGLDGHPDPSFAYDIGSSLQFRAQDRRFEGGTGYGGGCDFFQGTFSTQDGELRLVFQTLRQGCGPGSPQQIVDRLVVTERYELHNCTGSLDDASPSAGTTCEFLYLRGPLSDQLLVYRHSP